MAFKGKHVLCNSTADFCKKLADFLVTDCGWIHDPNSPTKDLTARTAQEDKHAFILGWFLKSNGEDGNQNIPLHIGTWSTGNTRRWHGDLAYVFAGILSTDTVIPLVNAIPNLLNGDMIQIADELIQVGIAGATLTSCVRGMYGTTAVAHDAGDVALRITNCAPALTIAGVRDLVNPLMSSTGTVGWSIGTTTCATDITTDSTDLHTTYDDYKIDNCTLVKVADGRMRFITTQTCEATGKLRLSAYSPFYTAPGVQHVSIISPAMHPQGSRHQTVGGAAYQRCPCLRYDFIASPKDCWFYGSKDGVSVVVMMGNNNYIVNYIGLFQPYGNTVYTTAAATNDGAIAAGATQIKVADAALFTKGGRYMLLSGTPGTDWHNNRNQVSNPYMGAPGGGGSNSWPNLDGDEAPFEYVLVTNVDLGTNVLTLFTGTCYSYLAGALIGECIRCHVGPTAGPAAETWVQFGGNGSACVWHQVRNDRVFTMPYNPVHRIRWRCTSNLNFQPNGVVKPWQADFAYSDYSLENLADRITGPNAYPEAFTGSQFLIPMCLRESSLNGATDYRYMGSDINRRPGYVRDVRYVSNVWNALNEDIIKVMFQGSYQTFRLFYCSDSAMWVAMGPETD